MRYLGFVLIAAAYLAARFSVLGLRLPPTGTFENPLEWMDVPLRLINTVKIDGRYLWLTVWPGLDADLLGVSADPEFKERLRRQLWELVQARRRQDGPEKPGSS